MERRRTISTTGVTLLLAPSGSAAFGGAAGAQDSTPELARPEHAPKAAAEFSIAQVGRLGIAIAFIIVLVVVLYAWRHGKRHNGRH